MRKTSKSYGICLVKEGSESCFEEGYKTLEEAKEEAQSRNENSPLRFNEDGWQVFKGTWTAYKV